MQMRDRDLGNEARPPVCASSSMQRSTRELLANCYAAQPLDLVGE